MRKTKLELRCSAEVIHCLGVYKPKTFDEHRKMRDAGHLLVRDHETMTAFFWPWQPNVSIGAATMRSS